MHQPIHIQSRILTTLLLIFLTSCEDFIAIDPPRTDLVKATVFTNETTANAAMINVYYQMRITGFASGNTSSISFLTAFASDELVNYSGALQRQEWGNNQLSPANTFVLGLWSEMYRSIYQVNAILEGLTTAKNISPEKQNQLEGEAKFIRALGYFYLVNLFGDVPLITTTDYKTNSNLPRTPESQVYQQILADLQDAKNLLPETYAHAGNERVRPNKYTASALLARVYLYTNQWPNAEAEATEIISSALYALEPDLTKLMTKNNSEAIWQLHTTTFPNDILSFYLFSAPPEIGALRSEWVASFEPDDNRFTNVVGSITNASGTFYFPKKYRSFTPAAEYSTVLRLAEQFLIRAEARAHQDKISEAQSDINTIRHRAGLPDTPANDKTALLLAVEQERKMELFTEHGHRWLDLKRTGKADETLAPIKGANWQPTDALLPIPESELLSNPSLRHAQNPGYQ